MSGHKVGYKGHYECPSTISLYCFSKEETGQDD
jgi:hypothetical protein